MAFPCDRAGVFADEEIEVCAEVGLLEVIDIEFGIAAGVM